MIAESRSSPPAALAPLPLPLSAPPAGGKTRLALFLGWLAVAGWLASRHVFWRDEVRALSMALTGDSVPAMLVNLHGEGHPALWYLLLRGGHLLIGPAALPAIAFAIGAGAAALWAWRAPFRPLVLAALLFGAFALHEYTVSARNYGMSMLLMFAFAALYSRWRARRPWLGIVLALLCNTNVPAVLLAGGLGLFWGVEVLTTEGWRWGARWRHWFVNMVLAAVGAAVCLATIYPPYNDAAVSPLAGQLGPATLLIALFNIAGPFSALLPQWSWGVPGTGLLLAALVVGAPLGLVRSPGGMAAALLATVAMPLFFQLVYPGGYRHQALFVAYLATLYWLIAVGGGGCWPDRTSWLRPAVQGLMQRLGQGALLALLLAQVASAITLVVATAAGAVNSRAAELGALLRQPALLEAAVIATPDVLLEPLPWYAPNSIWLVRERRWGQVVAFTKAAARDVRLGELLPTARRLRAATGRPVVIVLSVQLDPAAPEQTWEAGYLGSFSTTPADVRAFLGGTRRLARFAPAITDESYDVYLLR